MSHNLCDINYVLSDKVSSSHQRFGCGKYSVSKIIENNRRMLESAAHSEADWSSTFLENERKFP